jgi:hypothetical protein
MPVLLEFSPVGRQGPSPGFAALRHILLSALTIPLTICLNGGGATRAIFRAAAAPGHIAFEKGCDHSWRITAANHVNKAGGAGDIRLRNQTREFLEGCRHRRPRINNMPASGGRYPRGNVHV